MKKTNGVWTKKRYGQINSYLKDVAKDLKKKVKEEMSVEEFIEYELLAQQKLYKKHLKGNENLRFPTVEQAVTTATFGSYTESSSYENYLEALESQFYNVWDSNVREGYLTGQTTDNIVRKVVGKQAKNAQLAEAGAMHSFRNSVMANTRTALQAMASDTRKLIMERNADLFSGYEWVSTLDRRTCLVCGSLDGQIKLKITDFGEQPPIHFNCRCLIIPKIEGYDELDDDTRASKSGQVASDMSFDEWLKTQPEEVQRDVLGARRYEIFQKNGTIKEFVNDGKVILLKNLSKELVYEESIRNYGGKVEIEMTEPFIDSTMFNELVKYVKDNHGIIIDEEVGICDTNSIKRFVDGVVKMKTEYPELTINRIAIKNINGVAGYSKNTLYVDKKHFTTNMKSLDDYISKNVAEKNFIKNQSIEGVAYHECGHNLYEVYCLKKYDNDIESAIFSYNNSVDARILFEKSLDELKLIKAYIVKISLNCIEDYNEAIAEAFADYNINKDKAYVLSKKVIDLLLENLRVVKA